MSRRERFTPYEKEQACLDYINGNRLNVIIQHYKFNTFIAMFLIISEIYLFLFRTHVKLSE